MQEKVLAANMIVVSDHVVGCCKLVTALPTNGRSVVICLLSVRQWRHVLIVGPYSAYYFTFIHDMFVKFIRYVGTTVHDRVGLVLGVLMTLCQAKPQTCCSSIRFVALTASTSSSSLWMGRGRTRNRTQGRMGDENRAALIRNSATHSLWFLDSGYLTSCGGWRSQLGM